MDPHEQNHRRTNTNPQSIPLQDLSTPQRSQTEGGESHSAPQHGGRLRALTDISRDLWERGTSSSSPGRRGWTPGGSYSPIMDADRELSPTRAPAGVHLTIPPTGSGLSPSGSTPTSPIDATDFQAAIAGVPGLSFGSSSFDTGPTRPRHGPRPSLPSIITQTDSDSIHHEDREDPFSAIPLDTMPLTQHLAPISGAARSSTDGQGRDVSGSSARPSVHFDPSSPSSRLGDDLSQAESGALSPTTPRRSGSFGRNLTSLSPTSPLKRTGKILRQMSQRIVNISNEQDVVERSIRRKSSVKDLRAAGSAELQPIPISTVDGEEETIGRPIEKTPSVEVAAVLPSQPSFSWKDSNPLRGKSLGVFPPDNKLRLKLCDLLVHPWTEPTIFILIVIQTILLAIDSSRPVQFNDPNSFRFGTSWIDYCLLVLFSIYTVEIITRTIVSGFILNPLEHSTINRKLGLRRALMEKVHMLFGSPHTRPLDQSMTNNAAHLAQQQPSFLRSFTNQGDMAFQGDSRDHQRARLAHRAYLRHSFNRLDFVAVVAWWLSFILGLFSFESNRHVFVFRMLSCLRILRLLHLTSGTTVILRSLKKAAPLLVNVAFLIGFFWLLFAIVGVQSFKSSLRRECVWTDPNDPQSTWINNFTFCGGHLNATTGQPSPWLLPNLAPGAPIHKGYICPMNSLCIEGQNPYNGSVSFDNIFQSLELVFVIMTTNTFTDLMYYLTNSDYLAAALFFAVGIIILFFWLVNLLVAVITSSFQVIREESKTSAFTGEDEGERLKAEEDKVKDKRRVSTVKKGMDKTKWAWILVISTGIVVQCMRSANMGPDRRDFINNTETVVTFLLLLEIVLRIIVDWRNFFRSKRNLVDLGIALITSIIQLPPIRNSGTPYAWLTIFQIIRFYRVVLATPLTRELILTVLGNFSGLLNLILFVFLLNFLAAILASQMFRGTLPAQDWNGNTIHVTFRSVYNSFLGMYQIFSSENWTTSLYYVTNYDIQYNTAWMGAAFFILWFILANFIVMNMFIAVIQENFDVSEDEKRLQQVKAFLEQKETGGSTHGNLSLSTIFRYGLISGKRRDPLAFGSATTEMLLKDAVVKDFLDQGDDDAVVTPDAEMADASHLRKASTSAEVRSGTLSSIWTAILARIRNREPNPFYSRLEFSRANEELDPRQMAKEVMSAHARRKRAQRDYLLKHPKYNVSLFLFGPRNTIRRFCQRIVGPGRGGDRIEGVVPSIPVWYAFSAFIYAAIVAMVILACITTPLYQKEYFQRHVFSVRNWFVFSDMGFAILFAVEALIKVIADGFFWTPNAFFRSSWGFIDGIVLITLWINIATALYNEGQVSRIVGAFKALRALRLLNVSDSARNNFHAVIVRGGIKVVSAAFVSLSLLIPFAIYGLNLFLGKLLSCNDTNSGISDLNDCVGEYGTNSPYNWNVYAPRVASNSYYSFDNFGGSLFILFQIVSQEGWVDVMWAAESITGAFRQPQSYASQGNALFFLVFNLLGSVFVLTLFVSVFMRNYTEQTGVAFLTSDQRSWLELRKLLRQISPSKRPLHSEMRQSWKEWCYRRAVRKTGRWHRAVTTVLVAHLVLLCIEYYPSNETWDIIRDYMFLGLTFVYISNIVIRIIGLTWTRFRKSSWDIYAVISVSGTLVTTILALAQRKSWVINILNKLCLVSIALLLIPRNNQLDQLFKTAAASLPLILNLLATWFVLFLAFAIALTQTFGLTRFGSNETANLNFRNVPKALILLFRTSLGEGWNQIMEDFASARPPFCVDGGTFENDCGSPEWARALFISWNILSMYIFVNLFVSLIYESFSYVYHRSSGLSAISREEIRRFKQAWAEFDPNGAGYISKEAFPRLLGELSGVFEMRIYDGDFTVKRLIDDCSINRASGFSVTNPYDTRQIDLKKLNERLKDLPVARIRVRRERMNKFYEEVLVSSDPDRGISFTSLLLILAHYKVINDNKSLRLDEFLRRRARLQRVDEAVRRNVVVGFFDTVFWSRHLRRHVQSRHAGRMTAIPQFTIPEIYVDDEYMREERGPTQLGDTMAGASNPQRMPEGPQFAVPDVYVEDDDERRSAGDLASGYSSSQSGIITPPPRSSIQLSPTVSPTRSRAPPFPPTQSGAEWGESRNTRAPLGVDEPEGSRSRAGSSVSAQNVLEALDNSAWGESIRKSFSTRRPSDRPPGMGEDD